MARTIDDLVGAFASQHASDWPELDAQLILGHVLDKSRTWISAHGDTPLTGPQIVSAQNAFDRLKAGEPLPYIIGHWDFFGLEFEVTRDVLIPRPETELLVEKALLWLQASTERRTVADIGTGSGIIATTIALHIPGTHILATDISYPALKVAQRNAQKFNVLDQIDLLQCDLLPRHIDPLPTQRHFDLICANLPYIPTDKLHFLAIYESEPALALDGGRDGLDLYRRLFEVAPDWLAPGGMMLFEIEATLGSQALSLAFDAFSEDITLHLHQDLAGHDRLLEIIFP